MFYKYVNVLLYCETEEGLTSVYDEIFDLYRDGGFTYDEFTTLGKLYNKLVNYVRKCQ